MVGICENPQPLNRPRQEVSTSSHDCGCSEYSSYHSRTQRKPKGGSTYEVTSHHLEVLSMSSTSLKLSGSYSCWAADEPVLQDAPDDVITQLGR